MMNLSEMFSNSQGQAAIDAMAGQFGLSRQQTEQAVAALLPAFSIGMQQQAKSMEAFQQLIGSFGTGQHLAAFEYPNMAMTQPMMAAGSDFMRQIFGGSQQQAAEIQSHMVQQAASLTGIGATLLAKMLPVIASMILGGLFKGAMNNGLGGLLEQMMRGGLGGGTASPQQNQPPQSGTRPSDNPLGDLLGSIFGAPGSSNASPSTTDPYSAGIDILKGMFKTGQDIQSKQVETMESIFDQVLRQQRK